MTDGFGVPTDLGFVSPTCGFIMIELTMKSMELTNQESKRIGGNI